MGIVILLFTILVLVIRTPQAQKFFTEKAESWYLENTGAKLTVEKIYLNWNNKLVVEDLYLEDDKKDTLLFLGNLSTRVSLLPLLDNSVILSGIDLSKTRINLSQSGDEELFNFQFIIDSLTSSSPNTDTVTSAAWTIAVEEINLDDVNFELINHHSKTNIHVNWKRLNAKIETLNIDSLTFHLEEFTIDGAQVIYYDSSIISQIQTIPDTLQQSTANDMKIVADEINILNSNIRYQTTGIIYNGEINDFKLDELFFYLKSREVKSKLISLKNSLNFIELSTSIEEPNTTINDPDTEFFWDISTEKILLSNNQFELKSQDTINTGFDPLNFKLSNLAADISNASISNSGYQADIKNISLTANEVLTIRSIQSDIKMIDSLLTIDHFSFSTEKSTLSTSAFYNLRDSGQNSGEFKISNLAGNISVADIEYFYPEISQFPVKNMIKVSSEILGNLSDLNIQKLSISNGMTQINTKARLRNLISENRPLSFEIPVIEVISKNSHYQKFIPDSLLTSDIDLPQNLELNASLKGNLNDFTGSLNLLTNHGKIAGKAAYSKKENAEISYLINLQTDSVQLGNILKMPDFGSLSLNADVYGKGSSFESSSMKIDAIITEFGYKDYQYKDIQISGIAGLSFFDGKITTDQEDLNFTYDGKIAYTDSLQTADFSLIVNQIDLKKLNFSTDSLQLKTKIKANLSYNNRSQLNGDFSVRKTELERQETTYLIDSLVFKSINNDSRNDLTLDSDLFNGYLKGNIPIVKIPNILQNHFDQYFSTQNDTVSLNAENRRFEFALTVSKPELITKAIIPDLKKLTISPLTINFDSDSNIFDVNWNVYKCVYSGITIDSLIISLVADESDLSLKTLLKSLEAGDINVSNVQLMGESINNAINMVLNIPKNDKDEFYVSSKITRENDLILASLNPEKVLFRGNKWELPDNNLIKFSNTLWIENLNFIREGQMLSINSSDETGDTLQTIEMTSFSLENLTSALGESNGIVGGKASGQLTFDQQKSSFTSSLKINNLSYTEKLLGNLTLNANNDNELINIDATLRQKKGIAQIKGEVDQTAENNSNLNLTLKEFDISNFRAFADESISKLEGQLNADLNITEALSNPVLNGYLSTENMVVVPTYLNTAFKVNNGRINFNEKSISIRKMKLLDAENNEAFIEGNLILDGYNITDLSFNIKTDKFLFINSTDQQNEMIHAKAWVETSTSIKGNEDLYKINSNVKLLKNSDIVYIIPTFDTEIARGEGVVRFIDQDEKKAIVIKNPEIQPEEKELKITGFDIKTKIEVNEESNLSVIIDEQSGDRLDVNGNANLSFSMNPLGNMSLTGSYVVNDGSYKLNFYELAKREFQIVKGGSVTWTGDILEAQTNITTRYRTDAIPPFSSIDRKLPFFVNLYINGEILKPNLEFELSMPEDIKSQYANVYSYLQDINRQQTELNKQVFSLVLFSSFIVDNSTSSTPLLNNTARNSLSKIFSSQLNRLTGGINAVDINLGLKSYEFQNNGNNNSRTDLNLDLSKSLFQNKLVIKVSSNINLEGEENANKNVSDFIGDIVLEYKLTDDGRYRLKAFRVEEYDDLAQGEVSKTGVGFIILKDFDTLRELFSKQETN